jgi:gag-polypeptide of LTR copia-type
VIFKIEKDPGISMEKIVIDKLNNENYCVWSFKLKMLLIKENLWQCVEGSYPESVLETGGASPTPTNNKEISNWKQRDGKALATIALAVEDNQLALIMKAETSKAAWNALKEYHQKATLSNKVSLLRKICQMRLSESGDLETHLFKMEETFEKLAALGKDLEEDLRVAMILSSLPESYNTLTTALEARKDEDLTLSFVKTKLIDEFRKSKGNSNQDPHKALKISKGKGNLTCNYCKKPGHFMVNCRAWIKMKSKELQDESSEDSDDEKEEKKKPDKFDRKNTGNSPETHQSLMCFSASEARDRSKWYVDSGAANHMCNDRKFFNDFKEFDKNIFTADGKLMKIAGIGSGMMNGVDGKGNSTRILMENVWYVPKVKGNLISVHQLTQKGLAVKFSKKFCKIKSKGAEVIAKANNIKLFELIQTKSLKGTSQGMLREVKSQNTKNEKCWQMSKNTETDRHAEIKPTSRSIGAQGEKNYVMHMRQTSFGTERYLQHGLDIGEAI